MTDKELRQIALDKGMEKYNQPLYAAYFAQGYMDGYAERKRQLVADWARKLYDDGYNQAQEDRKNG